MPCFTDPDHRAHWVSLFLAAALAIPYPGFTQPLPDCLDYADYVRPLGGVLTEDRAVQVAVAGNFAYVADGLSGLQIIDVSNPGNPQRVGGAATPGFAQAVAVDQEVVAVAAGSTLFLYDVTDPSTPQPLASVPATNPQGVALSGGRAFVADAARLLVVDISNPESPQILGATATAGPARDVAVDGSHVFVAVDQAGLQIIDVANPTSPLPVGLFNTPGVAQGVVVSANHAYVADNWAGLAIVDISDPTAPEPGGSLFTRDQAFDVALSGAYAFVADLHEGVEVIDVSDPAQPRIVGRVKTPDHAYGVALGEGYAYVADFVSGLQVIDTANPLSPARIGRYDDSAAQDVGSAGDYACVTRGNDGLLVLDVSNPTSPSFLASLPLLGFATGVTIHADIAYVAEGSRLTVVALSDPAAPAIIGTEATPGGAFRVALSGSLACVAAGQAGLHIVDVSDPAQPRLVGTADTPGFAFALAVAPTTLASSAGGIVCVADGEGGLQLVDVTDPASPEITGSAPTFYPALGVATDGLHAFVATGLPVKHSSAGRFDVFDLDDPALPVLIASLDLPGEVSSVMIEGPFAYLAGPPLGLLLVDISDPASPRLIGGAGTLAGASNVAWGGDHVLVVDPDGVSIMNVQCNQPQPVTLSDLQAIPVSGGGDSGGIQIQWRAAPGEFLFFEVQRAFASDHEGGDYQRIGSLAADMPPADGWWTFLDRKVAAGQGYAYVVAGILPGGGEERIGPITATAPAASDAPPVWPNPTTGGVTLLIDQTRAGEVEVQIFNAGGRLVRRFVSGPHGAGRHTVQWDGRGESGDLLASGSYLVRLRWPGGSDSFRVTQIR